MSNASEIEIKFNLRMINVHQLFRIIGYIMASPYMHITFWSCLPHFPLLFSSPPPLNNLSSSLMSLKKKSRFCMRGNTAFVCPSLIHFTQQNHLQLIFLSSKWLNNTPLFKNLFIWQWICRLIPHRGYCEQWRNKHGSGCFHGCFYGMLTLIPVRMFHEWHSWIGVVLFLAFWGPFLRVSIVSASISSSISNA